MFEAGFPCELQDKVHKVLGKMSLRTYNNISRGVSDECIKEEYILLDGINDSDENAKELAKILTSMNACVNLIPYNETENMSFKRSRKVQIDRFYDILLHSQKDYVTKSNLWYAFKGKNQLLYKHCPQKEYAEILSAAEEMSRLLSFM